MTAPSDSLTAEDCWTNALRAVQANDGDGAEHWFRQCIARKPDYPNAALNLGMILTHQGKYAEAAPILQKAAQTNPSIETYSGLAGLLQVTGRNAQAKEIYEHILRSVPDHAYTLFKLGEVSDAMSDRRAARDYYRRAMKNAPTDITIGMKYAIASWNDDPAETVEVHERLLKEAGDDAKRITLLSSMLMYKEFHERMKRGLMPYHATSLDELFYTYAAPEFETYHDLSIKYAAGKPDNPAAVQNKASALFCARNRPAAQECLNQLGSSAAGTIWENVTFDPAFYKSLEQYGEGVLTKGLPPVQDVMAVSFEPEPIAYLSCNYTYFTNFCEPMIRSLADKAPGAQVHVHIMDAAVHNVAAAVSFCRSLSSLRIALSVEQPGVDQKGQSAARSYYHSVRFIRYYQHLIQYQRTLWLMDVDALFNRDPRDMYEVLGAKDAAMRIRAGRLEPWNQFNACIVAATPNPASVAYFRLIAAYIAYFYQQGRLRWGIDQMAMYGTYEYLRDQGRAPTLAFLDDRAIDYEYLDDGIVWCNSGKTKFSHLQRNKDGSLIVDDPDRAKYLKLFDKYFIAPKT